MKHLFQKTLLRSRLFAVSFCILRILMPQAGIAQDLNSGNDAASVEDYITLSKSYQGVSVEKSLKYSNEALILARGMKSDSLIAKAFKSLGTANFSASVFKECVVSWDSALFYFRKCGNSHEEKNVINNLGVAHAQLGNYQTAVDYYMNCLNMHKMEADSAGMGHIYNNLGALYYELRAFKEALPYFERARAIAVQSDDIATQMHTSNNIGLILTELNRYDDAHQSFNESIIFAKKIKNSAVLAASIQNIGNVYMFQNQSDSALKYFNQGLELSKSIGADNAHAYLGIGWCWHQKGMNEKALENFRQAYEIAQNSGDQKVMLDALRNIYKASFSKGNKLEAYDAAVNYIKMFESVNSSFDSTAILNLQAKYLVNEKIHEIQNLRIQEQQHKEQLSEQKNLIKNQKALLHLSLTALIIFVILLILLFRINRKYKKTESELDNQNQMNLKTAIDLRIMNKVLVEQEEILRTLLETSPDTIQFKDDKGRWIKANQALLELFDLQNVDYQLKTDRDLAKIKPFYKETFESCMISDEMTWYKKQSTRSDEVIPMIQGGFKILDVIKVALYNSDGSRKGLIIIGRDITRRKEVEMQLNTALAKAEESDRLKSAFLRNMSHEIRTPLNAIIGFSDLLREDNIQDSERKEYLRLIEENGEALLSLITDIIDLAQVEAGDAKVNYTQFDLVDLINDEHKHFLQLL
ncbi:MAG: tetratricopeptide repeat protein, partial [Bacteroidales bacterium]